MSRIRRSTVAALAVGIVAPVVTVAVGVTVPSHAAPADGLTAAGVAQVTGTVRGTGNGPCRFVRHPAGTPLPAYTDAAEFATLTCRNGRTITLVPVRQEDSPRGYWLAAERGNGVGQSFVSLRGKSYRIR